MNAANFNAHMETAKDFQNQIGRIAAKTETPTQNPPPAVTNLRTSLGEYITWAGQQKNSALIEQSLLAPGTEAAIG